LKYLLVQEGAGELRSGRVVQMCVFSFGWIAKPDGAIRKSTISPALFFCTYHISSNKRETMLDVSASSTPAKSQLVFPNFDGCNLGI
jgi:hypothetical protein